MGRPTFTGIAARRLCAQRLTGEQFESPIDTVRWLTAVQSQDYGGAKWALGQRSRSVTDAEIDRLYDKGAILRTHVMRPTWHFVVPEDIRWLLKLTGPKVRSGLAGRHRELELDGKVVARAVDAFSAALAGGRYLTRPELGEVLRRRGIAPDGQRLPHLLLSAELDGLIVSGPRRGTQLTYALMTERAPKARVLDRLEAIAELTLRYFRSHGPAQLQDFAWWSGLTLSDARTGVSLVSDAIAHQSIEGKDYWFHSAAGPAPVATGLAHLLPNFDEYTVAYRDRAALIHADHPVDLTLFAFGSILSNVVTVGGRVRGSWRKRSIGSGIQVEMRMLTPLPARDAAALNQAANHLGRFLERPVKLVEAGAP